MKNIKAIFKPTKISEPRIVYFYPIIREYFSPSSYALHRIADVYGKFLENLQKLTPKDIEFIPVTVEERSEVKNRLQYIGFGDWNYDENNIRVYNRNQPLIIRGIELPEFQISTNGKDSIWVQASFSSGSNNLTNGARNVLKEQFAEVIINAATPELLKTLVEMEVVNAKENLSKYIEETQKELLKLSLL